MGNSDQGKTNRLTVSSVAIQSLEGLRRLRLPACLAPWSEPILSVGIVFVDVQRSKFVNWRDPGTAKRADGFNPREVSWFHVKERPLFPSTTEGIRSPPFRTTTEDVLKPSKRLAYDYEAIGMFPPARLGWQPPKISEELLSMFATWRRRHSTMSTPPRRESLFRESLDIYRVSSGLTGHESEASARWVPLLLQRVFRTLTTSPPPVIHRVYSRPVNLTNHWVMTASKIIILLFSWRWVLWPSHPDTFKCS